jgi:general secretion pathway protein D
MYPIGVSASTAIGRLGSQDMGRLVMKQKHSCCGGWGKAFIVSLGIIFLLSGTYLCAAERGRPGTVQHKFCLLTHISAKQGRKSLAQLKLGTASHIPGTNAVLVTGKPDELARAATILRLIDTEQRYVIEPILPASAAAALPPGEQIAALVGDISIGTFSEPPAATNGTGAIIDVQDDAVVLIAPASRFERIRSAIETLQQLGPEKALRAIESSKPTASATQPAPKPVAILREPNLSAQSLNEHHEANNAATEAMFELATTLMAESKVADTNEPVVEAAEIVAEPTPEPNAVETEQPTVETEKPVVEPNKPAVETEPPKEAAKPTTIMQIYEPGPIPNGNETLTLNLPEKVDIVHLLGLVGRYLQLDFMYDPAKVKGDVTVMLQGKLEGPIKVNDLYPLLESVLKFKGFVMTRHKGNLVTVVPKDEALEIDPALLDPEKGRVGPGDIIVTRIFELKHIDTSSAENLLTSMKLALDVRPIAETKTLIVTGFAYRMPRIETLLTLIDKPGKPKKFRFRQLKFTMAPTLAEKVKILAEQLGTVPITVAAEEETTTTIEKRPGESDAAFARRRATELARQRAQRRITQPGEQPEPTEPTVYLDADERTNRVLMIGLEEQLTIVDELVDALDVEQQDLRTLKLYRIEHVGAEEVKDKLAELGIISAAATTSRITTPATQPQAAPTARVRTPTQRTIGEETEALVEEPQVVVIEPTNALLVNATAEQHARIAEIISYADAQAEQAAIPYVVYQLENQDPNQLQAVLEKLVMQTIEKQDKEAKTITKEPRRKEEEPPVIVADAKTYSLIVYAKKEDQLWIESLIKQLDQYRPQVLLDVTLVEITKNDEFSLDLDLITKLPKLEPGATMSEAGLSVLLSPFPERTIREATSIAGAGGKAFYADQHVQALLDVMQERGYGRILARPKLLVNDNEEGTIKTEEQTSIVREETQVIPGTAATAPTATTSVNFESFTAGITLTITPHISKGDQLQLTVTLNRTDFRLRPDYTITSGGQERTGPTPPDLLTSDVTTKVTVPDGTTIILGGLERLKQSKGGTKVPILGDIPFVGGLFRNTENKDDQSRLYVFVKAHILRPGEEAAEESDIMVVSRKNRERFEKYEEEMQKYHDWPGIKPKPMDPVRVLEDN